MENNIIINNKRLRPESPEKVLKTLVDIATMKAKIVSLRNEGYKERKTYKGTGDKNDEKNYLTYFISPDFKEEYTFDLGTGESTRALY